MLRHSDFVSLAPDNPGVVRINHTSDYCHGDSKSLKVERKEDGSITAVCFRCGERGWYVPPHRRVTTPTFDTKSKEEIDWNFEVDLDKWPGRALHWVKQYGMMDAELIKYGFGYSESQRRVIIPIWWEEEKVGYQARKIYDDDSGPKYISKGGSLPGFMPYTNIGLEEIVIVEDVISAIKVGRTTNSIALLSTNPSRKALDYIKQYYNFKIWLDMDNHQVIRQALKLLKSIAVFGNYKLIVTPKDPKCYSDTEIREHLYGS